MSYWTIFYNFIIMLQRSVAIFGGSFDPPHLGHLELARSIREIVGEVWVIPCGNRPDKPLLTNYELRLQMCKEAFAGINVSEYEKGKAMIPTYYLMSGLAKDFQDLNFSFIIGADLLESLHTWDCAERLIEEIQFIVINRAGVVLSERIKSTYSTRKNFRMLPIDAPYGMSSTEIRRIASSIANENIPNEIKVERINEPLRIRSVSEFIVQQGLYRV